MSTRVIGQQTSKAAFKKIWRIKGSPTLGIIGPISGWTLPAGVTFNSRLNTFVDSNGDPTEVEWSTQTTTAVNFLPRGVSTTQNMEVAGVVSTQYTEVVVQWDAATETAIANAWGIVLNSKLWRVERWQLEPLGAVTPTEISLTLVEGE